MGDLVNFDFTGHNVRVIVKNNEPWFVAVDVCNILDIKNSRDAISNLDEDEVGVAITDTLGGNQEVNIVNESGLYSLIFKSRKVEAKRFKKWVTSEVLPSIRKTGSFHTVDPVQVQQQLPIKYSVRMLVTMMPDGNVVTKELPLVKSSQAILLVLHPQGNTEVKTLASNAFVIEGNAIADWVRRAPMIGNSACCGVSLPILMDILKAASYRINQECERKVEVFSQFAEF